MTAQLFTSDKIFAAWVTTQPEGFVLNLRDNLSPNYLVLHKATCRSIMVSRYLAGALTERGYRKVGAANVECISAWIKSQIAEANGFTKRCSMCNA